MVRYPLRVPVATWRLILMSGEAYGGPPIGATQASTPGNERPPPQPASTVLRTRLTDRYGIAYPIVQAGIAFYATPALAAAVTNAGGLGVLGPVPEAPEGTRLGAGEG
jgi:hypothetical protein